MKNEYSFTLLTNDKFIIIVCHNRNKFQYKIFAVLLSLNIQKKSSIIIFVRFYLIGIIVRQPLFPYRRFKFQSVNHIQNYKQNLSISIGIKDNYVH